MRPLFDYQIRAVASMESIETSAKMKIKEEGSRVRCKVRPRCGVLACPTGSGKTATMLAFIASRFKKLEWKQRKMTFHRQYSIFLEEVLTIDSAKIDRYVPTTVVVVSPNVVSQWKKECEAVLGFAPQVVTTTKHAAQAVDQVDDEVLILVNEKRLKAFCIAAALRSIGFARVVYDESRHMQCITFPGSVQPECMFTWFISAASGDAMRVDDIFPPCRSAHIGPMANLSPALLEIVSVRTPENEVKFPGSIQHVNYKVHVSQMTTIMADALDPELQQRINANDLQGALQVLGASEESNLFSVVLSKIEREVRQIKFLIDDISDSVTAGTMSDSHARTRKASLEKRLEMLERQLRSVNERFRDMLTNGTCGICLDPFTMPVMLSCCYNVFCSECLLAAQMTVQKCPMCRSTTYQIQRVTDTQGNSGEVRAPVPFESKFTVLRRIMKDEHSQRSLIYSEWDSITPFLSDVCSDLDIKLIKLSGTAKERAAQIETFRSSEKREWLFFFEKGFIKTFYASGTMMFASAMSDCSGLDLPEATDIVLWHKMSHSKTTQIIGRCRRMSTKADAHCIVHHMYE